MRLDILLATVGGVALYRAHEMESTIGTILMVLLGAVILYMSVEIHNE